MKTIRDTIHGNITFSEAEIKILDTPEIQRLRSIKQLGFTYLVYPSATHTRFEHSLGTFYLACKLAKNLDLNKEQTEKLKIAALLHDVGHGPFSHSSEDAIKSHISFEHEDNTKRIIEKTSVANCIEEMGFKSREIGEIATGKKLPLGDIISGEVDLDRMDYLVRDSYYTGTAYGVIDLDRLLQVLKLYKRRLVVDEGGLSAAEALVRARYLMYPAVYMHHTVRIINAMFSSAVSDCLKNNLFSGDELYEMDDVDLISRLRNSHSFSGEMIQRIEQRRLYKRAFVLDREDLGKNFRKLLNLSARKFKLLETELQEAAGLKKGELLLDVPQLLYTEEAKASIMFKGKPKPLEEVSLLVKNLIKAQWNYWNVAVYCSKENVERVKKIAKDILLAFSN